MIVERPRSRHMADLLDEMAERYPDRTAVIFEGRHLTYSAFMERAEAMARGLYALGVRPGDRVAILMTNRTEWLEVAFGTFKLGATLVPLSTWYRSWELGYALKHSRAKVLITMERFRNNTYLQYLTELAPELSAHPRDRLQLAACPELQRVVVASPEPNPSPSPGTYSLDDVRRFGETVNHEVVRACQAGSRPEDLAYLLYTSGTTATPKGVMVQHSGCVANCFDIGERQHMTEQDRLWLAISLAWGLGAENALPAIMSHGGCIILQEVFDAGEALRLIAAEKATIYYATPNMTDAIIEHPAFRAAALRSLRSGVTIGVPEQIRRAIEVLGVRDICNVYGATETYGNCTVTDAHDPVEVRLNCQGRPLPGMEIRIIDPESLEVLPANTKGEIWVGGYVVPGYWHDPEKTAAAFKDGFYRSGDLGYLDEEGRLHYAGRLKDMIKTGGINVAPAEVEDFLQRHPAVKESYVVGIPDAIRGELVVAYVQLLPGAALTEEEIRSFSKARLATYKIPVHFLFITEPGVPRTVTGKVNKVALTQHAVDTIQAAR